MELIELIIRLIEWLARGDKKKPQQRSFDPVELAKQQADWERRRREWQELQNRQAAVALLAGSGAPTAQQPRRAPPPLQPVTSRTITALEPAAKPRPVPPAAKAAAIARWARPNNLRSQFILTEVLKPPLSLREPR